MEVSLITGDCSNVGITYTSRQKERLRTRDREKCYRTHTVDSDERGLSIEKWTEEKETVFNYDHRSIRGIGYYLVQIMYIPICFSQLRRLPTRTQQFSCTWMYFCLYQQISDIFYVCAVFNGSIKSNIEVHTVLLQTFII